jgi:hypothetical protein
MSELHHLERARPTRRELTIFFAALITALLVVGPLSVISLTHNTEPPPT